MIKNLKRRQVVFNMGDPYQRKLHEYTLQFPNFSGYIKRLIQRDMEGGNRDMKTAPLSDGGRDVDTDKALINGFI